jgi:potassium-transporting ATPase KdpC subunit
MFHHLRACLLLLVLTLLLCSVLYPLSLWAFGQTVFHDRAQGGLVDAKGEPTATPDDAVGAHLIAQPFTGEGYFQPRPSAASYNASASGASNWGPSNYLLRDRVARQLGPIVKYRGGPKRGRAVGPDIEAWVRSKPDLVARWAEAHPAVASAWVKADKLNKGYVERWQKDNPATPEAKPEDAAVPFFVAYSKANPGTFPAVVEKRVQPVTEGPDIQGTFFDLWLQAHPDADLEPVPADMVTASGSGLDPHITWKSALYQIDRVAAKWAADTRRDPREVRKEIAELLRHKKAAPMMGLAGVDLVNVLEVNLALRQRYAR